jgi:restriction endonuclease S subunit
LIDNEISKQTDEILFIKIENDGYDLGAQRRPIHKNDLPIALEILDQWKSGQKLEHKIAQYVAKNQIAQGEDYNLSGDRYRITTDYSNAKWPMVELGEVCEIITGKKDVNQGNPEGEYPFFTCAKEHTFIDTFSFDTEAILIAGNGDVGSVKYYKGKFDAYQRTYVLNNFRNINTKYMYYLLNNTLKENLQLQKLGNTMPYIKLGMLQTFKIPLPPLEIQEQIVAELDSYSTIINGATQITQNWKPKIDINPEWEKVKLGEVCDVRDGTHDSPKQVQEGYPLITSKNIKDGQLDFSNISYISEEDFKKVSQRSYVDIGDIIMPMIGTIGGACLIKSKEIEFAIKNVALFKKSEKIIPDYLLSILDSDLVAKIFENQSAGATQKFVSLGVLRGLLIPLPPLETQKQIVAQIEAERTLVYSAKQLIQIYQQKTKTTIAKLWEE